MPRGTYIKELQGKHSELFEEIQNARQEIQNFKVYLCSEKFHSDTTIQVRDVLNRLDNISQALSQH